MHAIYVINHISHMYTYIFTHLVEYILQIISIEIHKNNVYIDICILSRLKDNRW